MSSGARYRPSLQEMAERNLWPTPVVNDSRNGANATANRKMNSNHHEGTTLVDAVRLWPTGDREIVAALATELLNDLR